MATTKKPKQKIDETKQVNLGTLTVLVSRLFIGLVLLMLFIAYEFTYNSSSFGLLGIVEVPVTILVALVCAIMYVIFLLGSHSPALKTYVNRNMRVVAIMTVVAFILNVLMQIGSKRP